MSEQDYELGSRRAWLFMLAECLRNLGYESSEAKAAAWVKERAEIVQVLRRVCEEYGDNEWPEHLNLSDVIEKHLWRHLGES